MGCKDQKNNENTLTKILIGIFLARPHTRKFSFLVSQESAALPRNFYLRDSIFERKSLKGVAPGIIIKSNRHVDGLRL
jgi:hypothetical protein